MLRNNFIKKAGLIVITTSAMLLTPMLNKVTKADAATINWHANTPEMITALNNNGTYTIKNGDTLWAIGMHYNIKPDIIAQANNINDPHHLPVGLVLQLQITNRNQAVLITNNQHTTHYQYLNNNDKINQNMPFTNGTHTQITTTKQTTITKHAPTEFKPQQMTPAQINQYISNEARQADGGLVNSYRIKRIDNDRYFVYDANDPNSEPLWVVNAHTGAMLKA
ncbi:MAG: LysM peptidoglycan-binding domain-containing protein [Candidatus Paralactobacillus gallistercoris]|uniref:LysM peptidoglycan-binding domain-containing protein n=1 Tax=Candidatus Paralactobacillus gallistercoris TaxID=2838724 RepID=A0A948TKH0_9LACO|nr:LysM peptidoglycan-binding domain-containing protein [Candidatus Paralactobacillus gallistercoris]